MTASLEQIALKTVDGQPTNLGAYSGKVRLVVNVASKCGLTPQYAALESVYREYKERGLEVLAFPANELGAQEPGTEAEIKDFCSTTYDVTFPLFSKIADGIFTIEPIKGPIGRFFAKRKSETPSAKDLASGATKRRRTPEEERSSRRPEPSWKKRCEAELS